MPGWPWPDTQLAYYARKARRAMVDHPRAGELTRACLIRLAVCGSGGAPVADLKAWVRAVTLPQLRESIEALDNPALREWVERQVGWPEGKRGDVIHMRTRALWWGMRSK